MNKHFRSILTVCASLFSLFGMLLFSPSVSAHTSSLSAEPMVAIATGSILSSCTNSVTVNAHTSHAFIKSEPCELSPIQVSEVRVHLSQALAQHEAYVVLPSAQASQSVLMATNNQIKDLMEAEGRVLRQQVIAQRKDVPDVTCETTTHKTTVSSTAFGDSVNNIALWNESSDCNAIFINYTQVQGLSSPHPDYFDHTQYASINVGANCQYIGTGAPSSSINQSTGSNYYLELWINETPGCPAIGSNLTYVNIFLS